MPTYKVPIRNIQFAINEVLDYQSHYAKLPLKEAVSIDIVDAILEEGARFVENVIAPLNQAGDRDGCKLEDGQVSTPPGFKAAYRQFVENGWNGIAQNQDLGGQGLPPSLNSIFLEMLASANHAWEMYPSLTWGAISTIQAHADASLQKTYLPHLVSGAWSGTMCLTEPHCGSDLGLLNTKASPNPDGSFSITGNKIFISSGEHDLTDNIVHLVLARLPDAPAGTKGISLFLVPKFLVSDNGALGKRNGVACGSIEHKMGIHGNSTCAMNFDAATGYLLGAPHSGMRCMFTFINESRLGVAQQGHAHIETSFQNAVAYASERLQMRAPIRIEPGKPADPIISHADVRRMLLTQKAFAEGGRLLNYYCAQQVDIAHTSSDLAEKTRAKELLALLTPIAKGFLTEVSQEATSYGVQILGGHGYISEWGQEQHCRDARVTTIYEGTSGIQGLDLLGRKILASDCRLLESFVAQVREYCQANTSNPCSRATENAMGIWLKTARDMAKRAANDPNEINAASYDFLMLSGYCVLAYFLTRSSVTAEEAVQRSDAEKPFYEARMVTARFFFDRLWPRTESHIAAINAGSGSMMQLSSSAMAI
jgi:alkylation response protein AidB-like acyl-CoA dehydrogenase